MDICESIIATPNALTDIPTDTQFDELVFSQRGHSGLIGTLNFIIDLPLMMRVGLEPTVGITV